MRGVLLLSTLAACGDGRSSGRVTVGGAERAFDGGAMVLRVNLPRDGQRLVRRLVVTTDAWGFDCEWAALRYGTRGGADQDRPGHWFDLEWSDDRPGEVVVVEGRESVLGGGSSGSTGQLLEGGPVFDDGSGTSGVLETENGDVSFVAEDCGLVR
jgi:hypothetical protein